MEPRRSRNTTQYNIQQNIAQLFFIYVYIFLEGLEKSKYIHLKQWL